MGVRLSSFLLLIEEKNQKKIKASTEAGEAVRVREILRYVPGKLRRRPQPPCLDARKEAKENQGVRDASQFWGLSAILEVPGKTSPPSVEDLFLS